MHLESQIRIKRKEEKKWRYWIWLSQDLLNSFVFSVIYTYQSIKLFLLDSSDCLQGQQEHNPQTFTAFGLSNLCFDNADGSVET